VGGDWNLTRDPRQPGENIDVINMAAIPSRQRTLACNRMSENLNLVDAYRVLYPNNREFTYIPNAAVNINRWRIDFFLISESLAVQKFDAGISCGLVSKSFDHKQITLEFGTVTPKNFNKIDDRLTNNAETDIMVRSTVFESYLVHTDDEAFHRYRKNELMIDIGRINNLMRIYFNLKTNAENENQIQNMLAEASAILETLPDPEFFFNLPLSCEDDFFFEGLIMEVKNNTLSLQKKISKCKNSALKKKIDMLQNL
jgi:hypothetical protein